MKKVISMAAFKRQFATMVTSILGAVLFVCANTTSCTMIHQPESPAGLERFSKIK